MKGYDKWLDPPNYPDDDEETSLETREDNRWVDLDVQDYQVEKEDT